MWGYADNDLIFYRKLIGTAQKHPGSCDAVWLLIPMGGLKMEHHYKFIEAIKPIVSELRTGGIKVSLQCASLASDGSSLFGKELYQDIFDGDQTMTLYCWRNERVKEYFSEVLELYARELKPDVIWPDDDMGIRIFGQFPRCLCENCIAKFNEQHGYHYSKDELVQKINEDLNIREQFVNFSYEGIAEYAYRLAKAISRGSPSTIMGQQHGDYTGLSSLLASDAYMRAGGAKVMSRSGAGAYSDREPKQLPYKARQIEWQLARLPEYVTDRCPEVENYPHIWFSKSAYGTCLESTLHLAQGFNFLSYSAIPRQQEDFSFAETLFRELSRHRNYWDALEKDNRATVRAGAQFYFPENYWNLKHSNWHNVNPNGFAGYSDIGLPVTYQKQNDPVYILDGRFAACLSGDEIKFLTAKSVMTDAETLEILNNRGFGGLTGASAVPYAKDIPCFEAIPGILFTDHIVNAELTVKGFECMFGGAEKTYRIENNAHTEPLAVYGTRGLLGCECTQSNANQTVSDAVINTPSGGKWVVFGYAPWSENLSFQRRKQIIAAYKYIGGEITVLIEEPNRIELYPRKNIGDKIKNVTLLNTGIEKAEDLTLIINRPVGKKFMYMDADKEIELSAGFDGNGYAYVNLPLMDGWSAGTVFIS